MHRMYAACGRVLYRLLRPLVRFVLRDSARVRVLIVNDQNEALLIKGWLSRQLWSVPGGGARRGEDLRSAAVREVFEETGLTIATAELHDLGQFGGLSPEPLFTRQAYIVHAQGRPRLTRWRRLEIIAIQWWPLAELPADLSPSVLEMIRRAAVAASKKT